MNAACQKCSAPLVKVPSGYVCTNGCGKILSAEQVKALERSQLPRATLLVEFGYRRYTIANQPGIWEVTDKVYGQVRAFTGKSVQWFKRCPELERRIVDALADQLAEAAPSREELS